MAKLHIRSAVINTRGRVRKNNEDNFFLNGRYMELSEMVAGGAFTGLSERSIQLYAVLDGMGGEAAGDQAAFHAAQALSAYPKWRMSMGSETLRKMVREVSDAVYTQAQTQALRSGATMALFAAEHGLVRLANVGDSRAYRLQSGTLEQLTVDQTEVQRMVFLGLLTPEEARTHPQRNVIRQYLGMPSEEDPVDPGIVGPFPLVAGDRYLLCSDGLSDMLTRDEIRPLLALANSPEQAAKALVEAALQAGGKDNITAMVLFIERPAVDEQRTVREQKKLLREAALLLGAAFLYLVAEWLYRLF